MLLVILSSLAILATWVTARLLADPVLAGRQGPRLLLAGGVLGGIGAVLWMRYTDSGLAGAHQIFSTYVFLAVAAGSLLTGVLAAPGLRKAALLLTGVGLGTAVFNGITDTHIGQLRREAGDPLHDLTAGYDGPILIFNNPYRSALVTPDQYVAITSGDNDGLPDPLLISAALEDGLRVVLPEKVGQRFTEDYSEFRVEGAPHGKFPMVDIVQSAVP